jgi:uncharacterized protein (TIGR00725 family)
MSADRLYVAVVGPGAGSTDEERASARRVGELIGAAGAVLLCGGLDGVMASASEGAAQVGGTVVGLLPGDHRDAGNPHLTIALPTGLGELRNGLLVRCADVVVAVGGSWGTLSEVALAVRTGVPVVSLGGWHVDGDSPPGAITEVTSPEEGVDAALALARRRA